MTEYEAVKEARDLAITKLGTLRRVLKRKDEMRSKQEQADRDSMAVRNGIHPDTEDLVGEFSHALLKKLRAAEKKYGYSNKWLFADWELECRAELMRHIEKGDPLDVAAYCAFMWKRGWPLVIPLPRHDRGTP